MSASTRSKSLHGNIEKARKALADGRSFEAERIALETLEGARTCDDFALMAEIIPVLKKDRELRWEMDNVADLGEFINLKWIIKTFAISSS